MKRILARVLTITLLAAMMLQPAAAAGQDASTGMGVLPYALPEGELPSFDTLFGQADDLAQAQALLGEMDVNVAYGRPLTAAAKPYVVQEDVPLKGPVLYSVPERKGAYTSYAGNQNIFLLNEKMERVSKTFTGVAVTHFFAHGAEGCYYLGCRMSSEQASGTVEEDYDPYARAMGGGDVAKLGESRYVGGLCVVEDFVLAVWNQDAHTIGREIVTSTIPVFFDEGGTAYGFVGEQDGTERFFGCRQSGELEWYETKYQVGQDSVYLTPYWDVPEYLPTLKGEESLYPMQNEAGLFGYQDGGGGWVIQPQYQNALPFSGKYAIVTVAEGVKTLIDRSGALVEGVRGSVTLIPGYGYCVSYLSDDTASSPRYAILNWDGKPWLETGRALSYRGEGHWIDIQDTGLPFDEIGIDLEGGTLYVGDNIAQYGALLLSKEAVGTVAGRVLAYTKVQAWQAYWLSDWDSPNIPTYHKFGLHSSNTDQGLDYSDIYNAKGEKIASDVWKNVKVGNYHWIEKDSERGYLDQDGNWLYRETWDTGMTYLDVAQSDWFYEPVKYIWDEGLLGGLQKSEFGPRVNMIRLDLVAMLYRIAGSPEVTWPQEYPFEDAYTGHIGRTSLLWADQNSIVKGYGGKIFGTQDDITREQAVAILYRFAQSEGMDTQEIPPLSGFTDADSVSSYAQAPMAWAVANGILTGKSNGLIDPQGSITRAEMAAMVFRFCGQ